jgi:uncharacterized protein YjbJ (UPF0337 family)
MKPVIIRKGEQTMKDLGKKIKKDAGHLKDKIEGGVQENVGKATGNQEMELKGKVKTKVTKAKEKVSDMKEDVLEKVNDKIDEKDRKSKKK